MNEITARDDSLVSSKNITNKDKLWSLNFFLLFQGQLVSGLGDSIYHLVLAFWILNETGSTALMGIVLAVITISKVIVSPFAGVLVDTKSKRTILVIADVSKGILLILIGLAAYLNVLNIGGVIVAGVIIGATTAFYDPTAKSSIPLLVPKTKVVKANSVFGMAIVTTRIIGKPIGGILFKTLGAPFAFLLNGISYVISSVTELFIKIPNKKNEGIKQKQTFLKDIKVGIDYIWKFKGLLYIILTVSIMNLVSAINWLLLQALFYNTAGLGEIEYGFSISVYTIGLLLGLLFVSIIEISHNHRMVIFTTLGIIYSIILGVYPYVNNYFWMLVIMLISGFFSGIINVFIESVIQLTVPKEKLGKVYSIMNSFSQGLMPISMIIGGVLAEFISIKIIILTAFSLQLLLFVLMPFSISIRNYINYEQN